MNASVPTREAMVGREREREQLVARLEASAAGAGNVSLLAGEPGIGKSRLLAALTAHAAETGAVVLRGGAVDAVGMPPYLPFIEALGDFCRVIDADVLRGLLGSDGALLGTLLPGLPERLGIAQPSQELPAEQARFRLFEAVTGFLHAIAAERAILLVLDDLQWADSSTLDLLVHLVRRSAAARLAIAGAYRDGEVERNVSLGRTLAELNRLRVLAVIPVSRLGRAETAELLSRRLDGEAASAVEDELFRQSEGNPFFAEELLGAWLAGGAVDHDGRRWTLTGKTVNAPTILDAIALRLGALGAESLELLRTAAIVGRTFAVDLLAESAGLELDAAEQLLVPAVRLGVIVVDDRQGYAFTHDKIRECLYAEVTPARRRRLHGFIGRALELGGDTSDRHTLASLAFHFARSGDRARGGDYALAAMRAALESLAFDEAIAHGSNALAAVDEESDRRGPLLAEVAGALALAGQTREAARSFADAAAWFERGGMTAEAAAARYGQGSALWRLEAIPEARVAYERGLALLGDERTVLRTRFLLELGSLTATSQLHSDEGIALVEQAVALAADLDDGGLEAAANRTLGNLHVRSNRIERGLPMLERALRFAEAEGDASEAAECCACLLIAHYWMADIDGIYTWAHRQIAFAERARDLFQLRHVYCWLAAWHLIRGDAEGSDRMMAKQGEIVDRLGVPEPLAYHEAVRGMLALWRRDFAVAEVALRGAVARYRALNPAALVWHHGHLADLLTQLGRYDEAAAVRDEVEAALTGCPPDSPVFPEALTTLVPLAIAQRDQARIASYRARLQPFSGRLANNLIDRTLGQLATAAGDLDRADTLLQRADAQARAGNILLELARTLDARAELTRARGGPGARRDAGRFADEAEAIRARMGLPGVPAAATPPVGKTGQSGVNAGLAGLSEREREVLRLLVAGRSNREIAELLFVSEKTVANHLTSIFSKTGTENRVAAATYALRHGLT